MQKMELNKFRNLAQLLERLVEGLSSHQLYCYSKHLSKLVVMYSRKLQTADKEGLQIINEVLRTQILPNMQHQDNFYYISFLTEKLSKIFDNQNNENKIKVQPDNMKLSFKQKYYLSQIQKGKTMPTQKKNSIVNDSRFLNDVIVQISQGKIKLQNKNNMGMSEIFYQNHVFSESQIGCFKSYAISDRELFDKKYLIEFICAVANQGGGFIIAGINEDNRTIQGILDTDKLKIQQIFFKTIHHNIFPLIDCPFDFVQVKKDCFILNQNDNQVSNLYCVRFFVKVFHKEKVHYLKIKKDGFHDLFQIHNFHRSLDKPKGIQKIPQPQLYQQIQEKFLLKKQPKKIFEAIGFSPRKTNIKRFSNKKDGGHQIKNEISEAFKIIRINEEPKFIYKQSSLLIVGSQKKNQFIEMFRKSLKEEKKIFSLMRPFEKFVMKGGRVVWFLNYEGKVQLMKSFIKKCDKGNNFIFTTVGKVLRIPGSKWKKQKFDIVYDNFKKIYPEQKVTTMEVKKFSAENNCQTFYVFLVFDNLTASVLGFCLLESMGIKCFCTNEKEMQKSKMEGQKNEYY